MEHKFDLFLLTDLWVYDLSDEKLSSEKLERLKTNYNVIVLEWAIDGTVHLVGRYNAIQYIIMDDLKIDLDNNKFKPLKKLYEKWPWK